MCNHDMHETEPVQNAQCTYIFFMHSFTLHGLKVCDCTNQQLNNVWYISSLIEGYRGTPILNVFNFGDVYKIYKENTLLTLIVYIPK